MLEQLKKETNRSLTENVALVYRTTEDPVVDFFASAGAMPDILPAINCGGSKVDIIPAVASWEYQCFPYPKPCLWAIEECHDALSQLRMRH